MAINELRDPMNHAVSREQASEFVGLLQSLLRNLTVGSNDPAVELPLAQLRVCRVLCDGRRSISAISRELGVSLSAVTQIADRLERAKLVARVADGGDRRIRCLQLTARGERLLLRHDEERIRRAAAMLKQLTPPVRTRAAAVVKTLARAAAAARSSQSNHRSSRPANSKAKASS
jgi:DNA-binding MarR family transcriptional regulator